MFGMVLIVWKCDLTGRMVWEKWRKCAMRLYRSWYFAPVVMLWKELSTYLGFIQCVTVNLYVQNSFTLFVVGRSIFAWKLLNIVAFTLLIFQVWCDFNAVSTSLYLFILTTHIFKWKSAAEIVSPIFVSRFIVADSALNEWLQDWLFTFYFTDFTDKKTMSLYFTRIDGTRRKSFFVSFLLVFALFFTYIINVFLNVACIYLVFPQFFLCSHYIQLAINSCWINGTHSRKLLNLPVERVWKMRYKLDKDTDYTSTILQIETLECVELFTKY